jgi:hypothetical protein
VLELAPQLPSGRQVRDAVPTWLGGQESVSTSLTPKVLPLFPVHVVGGGTHVLELVGPQLPLAWQVRDAEPVSPAGQESVSVSPMPKITPLFPAHFGPHVLLVGPQRPVLPMHTQGRDLEPDCPGGQESVSNCPTVNIFSLLPLHVGHAFSASANEAPKTTPAGLHRYCPDSQPGGLGIFLTVTWMMLRPWASLEAGTGKVLSADVPGELATLDPLRNTSAESSAAREMVPPVGAPQR